LCFSGFNFLPQRHEEFKVAQRNNLNITHSKKMQEQRFIISQELLGDEANGFLQ